MTFVADTLFLCGSWASCYIHVPCSGLHKTTTQTLGYAPLFVMLLVIGLNAIFMYTLNGNWVTIDMEENFSAKTSYSLLWKFEKTVTCKRDPEARDRDETETFDFQSETRPRPRRSHISPRPRRDRDVGKMRLETVSRPRRRGRDYIPGSRSWPF